MAQTRKREMVVESKGKQTKFTTPYTDEQAHFLIQKGVERGKIRPNSFCASLAARSWKSWSPKQRAWAHYLLLEAIAKLKP